MSEVHLLHFLLGFAWQQSFSGASSFQSMINKIIKVLLFAGLSIRSDGCMVASRAMWRAIIVVNSCRDNVFAEVMKFELEGSD